MPRSSLPPHRPQNSFGSLFVSTWCRLASGYLDLYTSGLARYNEEHVRLGLIAARVLTDPLRKSGVVAGPGADQFGWSADDSEGVRGSALEPGVIALDDRLKLRGAAGPAAG